MNTLPSDSPGEERQRRRRARNWAVFAMLAVFVLLIYAVTIVKIKLGYGS